MAILAVITVAVRTNKRFLASLGSELETIVSEEAAKADAVVTTWGVEDVARSQKTWEKEGGQNIALSVADQKKLLETAGAVTRPILTSTPQLKEDYEAFVANLTGIRLGPNGLPNFWKRPGIGVPQFLHIP